MSSGLGILLMAIIAALSVIVVLHSIMTDRYDPEREDQRSRIRVKMELNDMEIHRKSHIIRSGDAVYQQHKHGDST